MPFDPVPISRVPVGSGWARTARVTIAGTTLLICALTGCSAGTGAGSPPPSGTPHPTESGSTPTPSSSASTGWQSPSASTSAPSPSSSATPTLIRYDNQNRDAVVVNNPSEVSLLVDAPQSFKDFVASLAGDTKDCPAGLSIAVERIRTDGYAIGSVGPCGGYRATWKVVDGKWQEIIGTQDVWLCPDLRKHTVPDAVVGTQCFDPDQRTMVRYRQA